jgi:bifunctional enzyme CysN/CysC
MLKNFTGIDSPYESPEAPDIRIDTTLSTAHQAAAEIIDEMAGRAILGVIDHVLEPVLR